MLFLSNSFPNAQGKVDLPTFGLNFMVNIGKYTYPYIQHLGLGKSTSTLGEVDPGHWNDPVLGAFCLQGLFKLQMQNLQVLLLDVFEWLKASTNNRKEEHQKHPKTMRSTGTTHTNPREYR